MHKRKPKEKRIGENNLSEYELVPKFSLGVFVLGVDICTYLHLPHFFKHEDFETFSIGSYDFYNGEIVIWTLDENKNRIWTIRCNSKCYWKGENLIGMLFDDFLELSEDKPNKESVEYVPINRDRGQNQTVYEFDKLGLSIWVWRNKIKTVLMSKHDEE